MKRKVLGDCMKQGLKQLVSDKFEELELGADQLTKLEQQISAATPQRDSPQKTLAWPMLSAVMILVIGVFLANQFYRANNSNELLEAIATEVASNHLKLKPLEVESENLRQVLSYFDRLEFQPVESASITGNAGDRLLGGRYCSIQGVDAAQLRLMSADGELSTLYEGTLPVSKLKQIPDIDSGAAPAVLAVKGLQVRIWREQGVVFAHASRSQTGLELSPGGAD
jgi:hypothetical protein